MIYLVVNAEITKAIINIAMDARAMVAARLCLSVKFGFWYISPTFSH